MPLYRCLYESPVGWIALLGTDEGLRRISLQPEPQDALAGLGEAAQTAQDVPFEFADVRSALDDYFAGDLSALNRIKVDLTGASAFFSAAWQACCAIPRERRAPTSGWRKQPATPKPPARRTGHGQESPAVGHPLPPGGRQQRRPPRIRWRRCGRQSPPAGVGTPAAPTSIVHSIAAVSFQDPFTRSW